jgi:hypothetical protein
MHNLDTILKILTFNTSASTLWRNELLLYPYLWNQMIKPQTREIIGCGVVKIRISSLKELYRYWY